MVGSGIYCIDPNHCIGERFSRHSVIMICNKCKRRVRDDVESKLKHIAKVHPDILLVRAVNAMFNPETTFEIGRMFGEVVKTKIKDYGQIREDN
jgi:hypothetical protein